LRIDGLEALVIAADALPAGLDGVLGSPTLRAGALPCGSPRQPGRAWGWRPVGGPHSLSLAAIDNSHSDGDWGSRLLQLTTVKGTVAALADTGAEGLFVTPELAARLHPLGKPQPLRLVGVCGEQPVLRQPMAGMTLGSRAIAPPQRRRGRCDHHWRARSLLS
jgi:hypothetical protein